MFRKIEMHLTHSSTAKQAEKQEERGSCQPLCEINNEKWREK